MGKSRRTSTTGKACVQGLERTERKQPSYIITERFLQNVMGTVRPSEDT